MTLYKAHTKGGLTSLDLHETLLIVLQFFKNQMAYVAHTMDLNAIK